MINNFLNSSLIFGLGFVDGADFALSDEFLPNVFGHGGRINGERGGSRTYDSNTKFVEIADFSYGL